jgi:hypothetical protein
MKSRPLDEKPVTGMSPAEGGKQRGEMSCLIGSRDANKMPLPPKAELEWWHQFYFATERGRAGYGANRRGSRPK